MIKSLVAIVTLLVVITSCSVGPQEINYGNDGCHYCKMTIVDRNHASELVTAKGKVYKYDAIECMLNDLKNQEGNEIALYLTSDFSNPGELISAKNATYLISEEISSPMGAFLSAFEKKEDAEKLKLEVGGELFTWDSIKEEIIKK